MDVPGKKWEFLCYFLLRISEMTNFLSSEAKNLSLDLNSLAK